MMSGRIRSFISKFLLSVALVATLALKESDEYKYPQNYFGLPIPKGKALLLAGTFGELRPNHFHGGIDIKTEGAEGMELLAAADGFVSRIKVNAYGYGRTLYIDHPNGYTTVYAHLKSYSPTIEKFVRKIQKENESWSIEVFPGKTELRVKKGDLVAISGNTGASLAPHLHFEIRETKTQTPIDPLLFGYEIKDDLKPKLYGVMVYPIGENSLVKVVYSNGKTEASTSKPINVGVSGSDGSYQLRYVKEIEAKGQVAFAVKTYDYHNGSSNKLGVPLISLEGDGKTFFKQDIERIPFSHTRFLNALIDYETKANYGSFYNRAHVLPGNELNIYKGTVNAGIIELAEDTVLDMKLKMEDRAGNISELIFTLKGNVNLQSSETSLSAGGLRTFKYDERNEFETDDIKLNFYKGSFYEDFDFNYQTGSKSSSAYSILHKIHNSKIPVQKYYEVSIKAHDLPEKYRNQAVIVRNGGSEGGYFKDGWVSTRTRYFGNFQIKVDSTSPAIVPIGFSEGSNLKWKKSISIKISDNLSGIKSYKTFIDGKYVIMEFDYKRALLVYYFDDEPNDAKHVLKIVVVDRVGNRSEKTINYLR